MLRSRPILRARPRSRALLLLASLVAFGADLAGAQELVFRAFGDSVTEGYGDPTALNGYPARLQRWLRQQGEDATVTKHGLGGETTAHGLSRIDEVLALGGDYLLLMEGTNDISQHVGIETIAFNLDQMADRAEMLGMVAVHASVIPRIPSATTDANNARTAALAEAVADLAAERHRGYADVFHVFEGLPDLFESYYYYDPDLVPPDPVGHPNTDGYIELAGVFLETVLPLLDEANIQIVPPGNSGPAGVLLSFNVLANEAVTRVEWDFGDGGYEVRDAAQGFDTFYIFREPGTYDVSIRGLTETGAVATDDTAFQVTGTAVSWSSRFEIFPAVESASNGLVVTDLRLANSGAASFALAEATFLPDTSYDEPPPVRRFLVDPLASLTISDLVGSAFGDLGGRGALLVELLAQPTNAALTAEVVLRAGGDDDGSSGCTLSGAPLAAASSAARAIPGIAPFADETVTFHVSNLDLAAGSVRLDLYDATSAFVGSTLFDLAAAGTRQRELGDMFRGLDARAKPFRAEFHSSGVRFAAALVGAGHGEQVRCLAATTP